MSRALIKQSSKVLFIIIIIIIGSSSSSICFSCLLPGFSLQPHPTPCTPTTEPIHPGSAGLTSVSLTLTFEVQNECGTSVAFFIYAGDYTKKTPTCMEYTAQIHSMF